MSRRNKQTRTRSEVEVSNFMRSVCLTCACMEFLILGCTDTSIDRFCKLGSEGCEEAKKQGRKELTKLDSKQASKQNCSEVRKQDVSVLCYFRLYGVRFSSIGSVHRLALIWSRWVSVCFFVILSGVPCFFFLLARHRRSVDFFRVAPTRCRLRRNG